MTQHAYRFAAFLQTVEIGFQISQEYQQIHQSFPANGAVHIDFVNQVSSLFHSKYPDQFRSNEPMALQISKDVALRAIDVISGNMHQFSLLFNSKNAPKMSSIHRQFVVLSSEQRPVSSDNQDAAECKKELKRK